MANDNAIIRFAPEINYDSTAEKFTVSASADRMAVADAVRDLLAREYTAVARQRAAELPEVAALAEAHPVTDTPQQRERRLRVAERDVAMCRLALEQFGDGVDCYGTDIRPLNAALDRAEAKLAEANKINAAAQAHVEVTAAARDAVYGLMNFRLHELNGRYTAEAADAWEGITSAITAVLTEALPRWIVADRAGRQAVSRSPRPEDAEYIARDTARALAEQAADAKAAEARAKARAAKTAVA